MTVGFTKVRQGHALAPHRTHRKRDSCATGGFYKSPTAGESISYTTPVNITWDTSCMNTSAVDIYLYAPSLSSSRIYEWQNVEFSSGGYNTTIQPKWYNSTSSMQLQFAILPSGTPPFMATLPAGPVFTATYTKPADGTVPATADTSSSGAIVQNVGNTPKSTPKGTIAAAVLVPLLILIGLGVAYYIRQNRMKGKDKRKRWSEAVDKRMSTISTDWKSVSAAGATAAIRNSMAVSGGSGNRNSSFSFGGIRPSSEATAVEGGQAGVGSQAAFSEKSALDWSAPHMSHVRPGVRTSAFGERVSRVSFAPDTRPASEARRTRAFHTGIVPPLPGTEDNDILSPTQAAGAFSLTAEDIRSRMSGNEAAPRPSFDDSEFIPALSMMRNGGERNSSTDELMFPASLPSPPPPAHAALKSSIVGMMPMQPMPANVMSPDEMLRAYAERRAVGSPPAAGAPAFPEPAVNYNGNGMRTLYSPTSPDSAPTVMPMPTSPESLYPNSADVFVGGFRMSIVPTVNTADSRYAEEDYEGETGTAE